jgi:hypothetical protein
MARGWESKSVEEQMANALGNPVAASEDEPMNEEERRSAEQRRAARTRRKQGLKLQRENILSQKTVNPGRRAALEAALAQIDAQLQSMG